MRVRIIRIIIPVFIFALNCGGFQGEFAVKGEMDDVYRRIKKKPEFSSDAKINWIYSFKSVSGYNKIGVVLLKKEIEWVDIYKRSDYIDSEKKIIYGKIERLKPGRYKIVLTDISGNNSLIASLPFMIYAEKSDEP